MLSLLYLVVRSVLRFIVWSPPCARAVAPATWRRRERLGGLIHEYELAA